MLCEHYIPLKALLRKKIVALNCKFFMRIKFLRQALNKTIKAFLKINYTAFYLLQLCKTGFTQCQIFKEAGWSTRYQSDLPSIFKYDMFSNKLSFSNDKKYILALKFDYFDIA